MKDISIVGFYDYIEDIMEQIFLKKENKKAAIVSLGDRISLDAANVRSVDLKFMRLYLEKEFGRVVDFVNRPINKDYEYNRYYKNIDDVNLNDYDEVWIYNSQLNLTGGTFEIAALTTFEKLCDFNKDIYYVSIDPKLPCKNFAELLLYQMSLNNGGLKYGSSNNKKLYKISMDKIEKYTNEIWPRIIIAFDGLDYNKFLQGWHKETDRRLYKEGTKTNKFFKLQDEGYWCQFFVLEYYALNERLSLKLKNYDYKDKKYDLIYFGNKRANPIRNKIFKSLHDDKDFNILFVGYNPEFKNAKYIWMDYVDHNKLFPLISKSYCTIVLCDPLHSGNSKTSRFHEAMLLDTVALIHTIFDPEHKYIQNKELADFIYIDNVDDVKDRLNRLKNDEELYHKIVELERKEMFRMYEKYRNEDVEKSQINIMDLI